MVSLVALHVAAAGAMYARNVARRALAKDAEQVLAKDKRPPILYLRQFHTDDRRIFNTGLLDGPAEEGLVEALGEIGPVIAFDQPNKFLVPLGAARLRVGDDWQARLLDLLPQLGGVVMHCAGQGSAALDWEVKMLVARVPPTSLLLDIPPREVFSAWADRYRNEFPRGLPLSSQLDPTDDRTDIFGGFVRFEADWRPRASWDHDSEGDIDFLEGWPDSVPTRVLVRCPDPCGQKLRAPRSSLVRCTTCGRKLKT